MMMRCSSSDRICLLFFAWLLIPSPPLLVAAQSSTVILGPPPTPTPTSQIIEESTPAPTRNVVFHVQFEVGTGQFQYQDDAFRNTNRPAYAHGTRVETEGALQVQLGRRQDGGTFPPSPQGVERISGGWQRTFDLAQATPVKLSFSFRLSQSSGYESDQVAQALASIDGQLIGQAPYNVVQQVVGNGSFTTTGWKLFQVNLGVLQAGSHSLVLGGFLSQQTQSSAVTTILFDNVSIKRTNEEPDPTLFPHQAVDRLEFELFKENIRSLASFGDRLQGSSSYRNAAAWVEDELTSVGYVVERAPYLYQGAPRNSLYVTKVGTKFPDRMWIVSAHLDGRGNGGAADDDASGCSLVLEMAKVLASSDITTEISIRLVFWNNEETGLNGSRAYANGRVTLQGQEDPLGSGLYPEPTWLGVIQHDMILFDHGLPPRDEQIAGADADIEYRGDSVFGSLSRQLANALLAGNAEYAEYYPAEVGSQMSNTDSVSFMEYAPSVSLRENQRTAEIGRGAQPHWHQPTDLFSTYSEDDFLFGFNIVQTTFGTVAELAGLKVVDDDS